MTQLERLVHGLVNAIATPVMQDKQFADDRAQAALADAAYRDTKETKVQFERAQAEYHSNLDILT